MLFYNHKQEFIGIDEEGLKLLNYATFDDLMNVCSDVADLFAKEPGYIHNFKSFGWIDFLLHADSDARSAIVQGNGRTFSCTLQISTLFLATEPSSPGYIIEMLHVQSLSGDEIKPHPSISKPKTETKPFFTEPVEPTEITSSVLPNYDHITPTTLSEPGMFDVPTFNEPDILNESVEDLYTKYSLPEQEESQLEDAHPLTIEPEPESKIEHEELHYTSAEKPFLDNLKVNQSYRFDPSVAAQELGLPVDLIQEFIGDFILQSKEFKEELFEAALKGDMNNLKILSHKLKGVAANLRIEDAFETLSIINTSNDPIEIEANLKYFYNIISKLEGKDVSAEPSVEPSQNTTIELDDESYPFPEEEPYVLSEEEPLPPLTDGEIYSFDLREDEPLSNPSDEETQIPNDISTDEDIYSFNLKMDDEPSEEPLYLSDNEPNPTEDLSEPSEHMISEPVEEPIYTEPEKPLISLHYDKPFVAGQLGIDLDFFNELIDEYKHDALRVSREINAAVNAFDTHGWKKAAAQLKGISDNLRLTEISEELSIISVTNDAQEANQASKRLDSFLEQL